MEGYAKLAQLMGDRRTDGHFLIFQKFESLSAQNILYLQAELANLQESIEVIVKRDNQSSDPEKKQFGQDWAALSSSENSSQWTKWLEIRCKLKEYYEAISQHRMMNSLPPPGKHDLQFLQAWLERPSMGNCSFIGADCDLYEEHKSSGLATLAPHGGEMDIMTSLIINVLPRVYHFAIVKPLHDVCGWWLKTPENLSSREASPPAGNDNTTDVNQSTTQYSRNSTIVTCGNSCSSTLTSSNSNNTTCPPSPQEYDLESNHEAIIFLYRSRPLHQLSRLISTVISSLIPITAIVILSFVKNMTARLAIVSAFTLTLSICLSLMTEAKKVEIFAAAAAFASVQVVFVGSTSWNI